jgi:hypothetical protein
MPASNRDAFIVEEVSRNFMGHSAAYQSVVALTREKKEHINVKFAPEFRDSERVIHPRTGCAPCREKHEKKGSGPPKYKKVAARRGNSFEGTRGDL